jgi:hypothetical protein
LVSGSARYVAKTVRAGVAEALPLAKLTAYIRSRAPKEAHIMISRGCQGVPVWSISSNLVSISGPPPKDPHDDDDENDEDENDDDEEDEEPAVIREPDEC